MLFPFAIKCQRPLKNWAVVFAGSEANKSPSSLSESRACVNASLGWEYLCIEESKDLPGTVKAKPSEVKQRSNKEVIVRIVTPYQSKVPFICKGNEWKWDSKHPSSHHKSPKKQKQKSKYEVRGLTQSDAWCLMRACVSWLLIEWCTHVQVVLLQYCTVVRTQRKLRT